MKDIQQLIKKNSQEGRYESVFPKTFTDAVIDRENGAKLTDILAMFNMLFLSYVGSKSLTRLEVPVSLRKTGIWITYVLYDKTVVTEWYAGEAIDDTSFSNNSNWRDGSNSLVGDISVSSDGYWVVNGVVTTTKAQGEQGITPMLRVGSNNRLQVSYTNGSSWVDTSTNPVYTQFRINNNKLEQSVDLGATWIVVSDELAYQFRNSGNKLQVSKDLGVTWEDTSDYIAAWFKFTGTTQADNVGKIQISRDNGSSWTDLSGEFTNSLHIKGYVASVPALPSSAVQGDIYGVGPTYDPSDTDQTNPIYQLYVKDSTGWVNNGKFTSIAAGVVQTTGTSTTEVMSQNAVTTELDSLRSDLTETTNRISILQGKDYTPLMEVGYSLTPSSTVIGDIITLTRGVSSVTNSIKIRVYKGESYDITGEGGAGPRLYIITDLDNKLVSIATAGLRTSLTINIEKDGYLTVNARNDNMTYIPKVIVKSVIDYVNVINNSIDLINQSLLNGNIVNYMPINIGTTMVEGELITNYPARATTDLLKSNFDIRFESKASNFTLRYAIYDSDGVTVLSYENDITSFIITSNTNYRVCFAKSDGNIVDKNEILSSVIASFIEPQVKKKWFALGDSITQGFVSYLVDNTPTYSVIRDKCWVTKLSNIRTDLILTNYGRGGEGYLDPDFTHTAKDSVDAINFADCDIATLAYGINDWKGNQVVGTVSDSPTLGTTVLSNMKYCIEKIISDNPACKIYIISPLNCMGYAFDYGDESTNYALGYTFSKSGTLESFVGKLKEVAEYYGIEFIDMTHNSVVNRKSLPSLLIDGVHPSEFAHNAIAIDLSYKI